MNTLSNAFSTVAAPTPTEPPKLADNHFIVFGLGNIGSSFVNTRHNIGRDLVHKLADELNSPLINKKNVCDCSDKITIGNRTVTLAVPDTYMNISGKSVRNLSESLQTPHKNIIVIHDDLDLPVGHIRVRDKGTSGGQNGVKDILKFLGEDAPFTRVKLGIGRPAHRDADISDYVLGRFSTQDREELRFVRENVWSIVKLVLEEGAEKANNKLQVLYRNHLIATGKLAPQKKNAAPQQYTYEVSRPQDKKPKKEDLYAALARRRPGMAAAATTAAAQPPASDAVCAAPDVPSLEEKCPTEDAQAESMEGEEGAPRIHSQQ